MVGNRSKAIFPLLLMWLISCGAPPEKKIQASKNEMIVLEKEELPKFPEVKDVKILPELITEGTDLKVEVLCNPPNHPFEVHYIWMVNSKKVGSDSPELSGIDFKKGDFVWVRFYFQDPESGYKSKVYESKRYKVLNSPPVFDSQFPSVKGMKPGDLYVYKLEYHDPDDPQDKLKVELLEAPEGAVLERGVFKWKIPKKEGEYSIKIVLKDPEGLTTVQSKKIIITTKTRKSTPE